MACISKSSQVIVDGAVTRWAAFSNKTVALNASIENKVNVWGYNDAGEFWFQIETGTEIDAPYLNQWFYKQYLEQSEKEGKHTNRYLYEYAYRCYKEAYDENVQIRTIWLRGNRNTYNARKDGTYQWSDCMRVIIPIIQFYNTTKGDHQRHAVMFNINSECMPFSGVDSESYRYGRTAEILFPRKEEHLKLLPIVENNIKEIHNLISEYCKFTDEQGVEHGVTPENISQIKDAEELVTTRVKVAKVINDWVCLHVDYLHKISNSKIISQLSDKYDTSRLNPEHVSAYGWWMRSLYGTLAKNSGVCAGFDKTIRFLLNQYGIETLPCHTDDNTHVWTFVNYYDEIGEYTKDRTKWCEIDVTPHLGDSKHSSIDPTPETIPDLSDNTADWSLFNFSRSGPRLNAADIGKNSTLPTYEPANEDHRYTGNKIYEW